MTQKLIPHGTNRNVQSRLFSLATLNIILILLISCDEKDEADKWDIVVGEYTGLLYISKPLIPLHEAEPYPNQTVQVTKVGPGTYRLSSTNPSIPNFDFRYDHQTTTNTGVIYNEYYFTIADQTVNGVTVQANTLVFGIDTSELDFTVSNGSGDTIWLFGGEKK